LHTRFLLPNRIRWNTFHTIALRTTEPAISNVYLMVRTSITKPNQPLEKTKEGTHERVRDGVEDG
jgi:hypothetical protein